MDKNKKRNRASQPELTDYQRSQLRLWNTVAVMTVLLFALVAYLGYLLLMQPPEVTLGGKPVSQIELDAQRLPTPTDEAGTELVMVNWLIPWYQENNDLAGWLRIDGTKIDEPVVYTPENEKQYLRKNFNGKFSMGGTLILGAVCSIAPESDNLIIYGHNMRNGTMFRDLMNYRQESYWQEHPVIEYATLYEERQYEIVAAFYDVIYDKNAKVFKFYQFANYETEAEFADAMAYFKSKSEYDTGVEPVFGDRLLTLVTCSYHTTDGRFVVLARQIPEESADGA